MGICRKPRGIPRNDREHPTSDTHRLFDTKRQLCSMVIVQKSMQSGRQMEHRLTGSVESFFAWAARHGSFGIVCRTGIRGKLDVQRLVQAIQITVQRDAFLSAKQTRSGTWFGRLDVASVPPAITTICRKSSHHWQELFEDELNSDSAGRHSPAERGNIRAIILHGTTQHDLVLSVDHTICDGKALVGVIRSVVLVYSRLSTGQGEPSADHAKCFTPPLEALVSVPRRADAFFNSLTKKSVIRASSAKFRLLADTEHEEQNRIVFETLSPDETTVILQNARSIGLTITELMAIRLSEIWQAQQSRRSSFQMQINVDLRRNLGFGDPYQSGLYSFWDTAELPTNTELVPVIFQWIRCLTETAGVDSCIPPLGFRMLAAPLLTLCDRMMGPVATSDISLSNLGRISFPDSESEIEVESMHFAASQRRFGSLLQVTATTVQDQLCFACITREGISTLNGRLVLSDLIERLLRRPRITAMEMAVH